MPENADLSLLRRFVATRDERAFAEIVRRQLDAVYSAALRRVGGDTHLAEDVAQQVFVALARKAATVASSENITGWLYGATRNEAANVVRTERRRKAREQEAHIMNEVARSTTNEADWSRVAPVLDAAIDELSENDRAAVLARFVEQRAYGEMGATWRISDDAARMRVERALEKLRGLLARRGVTSTGAALGMVLANHAVGAAPAGLAGVVTTAATAAAGTGAVSMWAAAGQFMANTKLAVGVAGVVALAAVISAVRETQARRDAEEALVAANRAHAAQVASVREWERRTLVAEQANVGLLRQVEDARAAAEKRATLRATMPVVKATPKLSPGAEGKLFLARHPEVKQALEGWAAAIAKAQSAPFLLGRGLTAAQEEEFRRLVTAWGLAPGMGPDGKEIELYVGNELGMKETQRRLRALLGEEGFKDYENFKQAMPARDMANKVVSALCFSEEPLTREQSQWLAQLLERNRGPRSSAQATQFDWDAVVAGAQEILSASQLAVLRRMRTEDQLRRALDRTPRGREE